MSTPNQGTTFLEEFKNFIAFLRNLWGILAGITVLFPLSNELTKIIPLARWPEGGLAYFSPELVAVVSTLTALFVILWPYGQRRRFRSPRNRSSIQGQARWAFAFGFVVLALYLAIHTLIGADFYFTALGWESGDLRRMLGDVILLFTYSAAFALISRAFILLGMLEYFGKEK